MVIKLYILWGFFLLGREIFFSDIDLRMQKWIIHPKMKSEECFYTIMMLLWNTKQNTVCWIVFVCTVKDSEVQNKMGSITDFSEYLLCSIKWIMSFNVEAQQTQTKVHIMCFGNTVLRRWTLPHESANPTMHQNCFKTAKNEETNKITCYQ